MTGVNQDWHGWSRSIEPHSGRTLHIGPLPRRKRIALYTVDYTGGAVMQMQVHAYFRNEDEACKALSTLDYLLGPQ